MHALRPWLTAFLVLLGVGSSAQAQILWSSPTGTEWQNATNWSGNIVPGQTDIAQFAGNPTSGTAGVGIDFNGFAFPISPGLTSVSVGAIEVTSGRTAALRVGSSNTSGNNGQLWMYGRTVNGVANTILTNGSGQTLTIENRIGGGDRTMALGLGNATSVVNVNGGGNIVINSNILSTDGGARALVVNTTSTGSLVLGGTNTFSSGITVNGAGLGGGLRLNATTALPTTGSVTVNTGGRLTFAAGGTYGVAGQSLTLNPNQTAVAALDTTSGTAVTWAGNTALSAAGRVDVAGTSLTLGGNVTGAGNLFKSGTGNLILAGTGNTRTGATEVNAGTVTVNSGSSLGNGGALTLAQTGTNNTAVTFNNAAQTIGNLNSQFAASSGTISQTITLNGTALTVNQSADGTFGNGAVSTLTSRLVGSGSLTKTGSALLTLGGPNSYTGATTVNGGVLRAGIASVANVSGAFGVNSNVTLANAFGVSLDLNGFDTQIGTLNGGGTSTLGVNVSGATLTLGGGTTAASTATYAGDIGGNGGLTKVGAGTQILSGGGFYTGVTTVNAGTLQFATTSSLYGGNGGAWTDTNIVVNNGGVLALRVGGSGFDAAQVATISALGTGSGGFLAGSSLGIDTTNGNFTYSNVIADTNAGANGVGFVKSGSNTLTLTQNNTYTGPTVIAGGTLQVGDGGTAGTLGAGAVTNNAALFFNRSDNVTVANVIGGTGGVMQTGAGTTTLTGTNSYTGVTVVNTGTLLVNGNQAAATGNVLVASGATLGGTGTLGGATTVNSGGVIRGDVGAGTGTLNTRNVTVAAGGNVDMNLGGVDGNQNGTSNRLNVGGNTLNLSTGAVVRLTAVSGFGTETTGTYTLATLATGSNILLDGGTVADGQILGEYTVGAGSPNAGPIALDVSGLPTLLNDSKLTLRRSGNDVVLSFTPVPEPAFLLAVCGLAVGGVVGVRTLRRKKGQPADVTPAA